MVTVQEIIYLKHRIYAPIRDIDEYKSTEAHSIALYVNGDNVIYLDSSGVEYNSIEIKKFVDNENITNIEYKQIIQ